MNIKLKLPIEIKQNASGGYTITDARGVDFYFYYENYQLKYDGCGVAYNGKMPRLKLLWLKIFG